MIWRLTEVGNMGETLQSSKDCLPILVMLLPMVTEVGPYLFFLILIYYFNL